MLIHLSETYVNTALALLSELECPVVVHPNQERSPNSLASRRDNGETASLIDLEWHSPDDIDQEWVADWIGDRSVLRGSTYDRSEAFTTLSDVATGPILAPGGRPDQITTSVRYASEMLSIAGPDRDVWATIPISRQGLYDPAVLMQLNSLHADVKGLYVVVMDTAGFPSAWTETELIGDGVFAVFTGPDPAVV